MKTASQPAFYALTGSGNWKAYVNLLHVPYTIWHLSFVVLGAAVAPSVHLDRLLGALLAFFLAVGIGAHALDELDGRPLGTRIPGGVLAGLALISLSGALALGAVAGLTISPSLFPFVAFGGFIAVAYSLRLWRGLFHSDFWFAFSWGAFPALTSYWVNSLSITVGAVLVACACFTLSLAQRSLSGHVRTIRRKVIDVHGAMEMADGKIIAVDRGRMISAAERALLLLSLTVAVLAAGMLSFRI